MCMRMFVWAFLPAFLILTKLNCINSVPYSVTKHTPSTTHTIHGLLNCVTKLNTDIYNCKRIQTTALSRLVNLGHLRESKLYRKQFCCGHWTQEKCILDTISKRCDRSSYEKLKEDKHLYSNDVDTKGSGVNCHGYEKDSLMCGGTFSNHRTSINSLVMFLLFLPVELFLFNF